MRKLMLFVLGDAAACAVSVYLLPPAWRPYAGAVCALLLGMLLLFTGRRGKMARIVCAGLVLGFVWTWGYEALFLRPVYDNLEQTGEISARISSYPIPTRNGSSVEARVDVAGRQVPAMLYFYEQTPDLHPGDRLLAKGSLRRSDRDSAGDQTLYLQSRGILLSCSVKQDFTVQPAERLALRDLPAAAAHALQGSIDRVMPEDTRGYFRALLTGDRSLLPERVKQDFSACGVSHTVAISGMHVSILLLAVFALTGRQPVAASVCGIPVLWFFVLFTGASPSVIRAAVVQTLVLLAPLLGRRNDMATALSAAMLPILTLNPWAIANTSFQLSFGAMAGLLLCTGPLYTSLTAQKSIDRAIHSKRLGGKPAGLLRRVLQIVCATLGAQVFTIPITLLTFGSLGIWSIPANVLILPVLPLCFVGGMGCALVGLVWPWAGSVAGWVLAWPVRWQFLVCRWIAGWPSARIGADSFYLVAGLAGIYLLIFLWRLLKVKNPLVGLGCMAAILGCVVLLQTLDRRTHEYTFAALDVGQGQCVAMITRDHAFVFDCGGSKSPGTHAAEYLRQSGVRQLDGLILSHYDADHVNGVEELLAAVRVQTLYLPRVEDDSGNRARVETAAREEGVPIVYVDEDHFLTGSDYAVNLFAPVSHYDDNAASLSVLFQTGGCTLLATGDMDILSEYDLMLTHTLPDVDVLVAGHHGAMTSTSAELLEQIHPEAVFISVGKNSYGHPAQETLSRILAAGAQIYRTDESGDIEIRR